MGAKKKAAKKAKKEDEEDLSVDNFWKAYRKKVNELQCETSKILKEKYDEYQEEGDPIQKFHIWEELGWAGVRAIMDALKQVTYPHCRSIRLWKTFCEDEGTRGVCQFLEQAKNVSALELLDNHITPLGCEFVGRVLHPRANTSLAIVKLDHNSFGSEGLRRLTEGMAINKSVEHLSLTYCNIDSAGWRSIFEILIFSQSKLKEIVLTGNFLRNEGIIGVLRGASIAKTLQKLYIADNQYYEAPDVLEGFKMCMSKNKELKRYDIRYNTFENEGIKFLTEVLGEIATHVYEVEISERVEKETLMNFREKLLANKPKKKKGKKKSKKK